MTAYSFAICLADSSASSFLLLYQMATFAPASANAWATANPMPDVAPDTMAVLPFSEKSGRTRSELGATVLSCVNFPSFISAMVAVVGMECV